MLTRLALQSAQRAVQHGVKIQKIISERRQQHEQEQNANANEDAAVAAPPPLIALVEKTPNKVEKNDASPTKLLPSLSSTFQKDEAAQREQEQKEQKEQLQKEAAATASAIADAQRYLQESIVPEQLKIVPWTPQVVFDLLKTEKYWDDQCFIFPVSHQLELDGPFSFLGSPTSSMTSHAETFTNNNNINNNQNTFHRFCIIFGKGNILMTPPPSSQSSSQTSATTSLLSSEQKTALSFCLQLLLRKNNTRNHNSNNKKRSEIFLYRGKELVSYLLSIFGSDTVYKNDGFADNIFDLGICHVILEKAGLLSLLLPTTTKNNTNNNATNSFFLETATSSFGALVETCFPSTSITTTITSTTTTGGTNDGETKTETTHFQINETILTCVNQTCTLLNRLPSNKNTASTAKIFNIILSGLLFRAVSQYRFDFCKLQKQNNNNKITTKTTGLDYTVQLLTKTEYYCALMSFHGVFVARNRLDEFMRNKWMELCLSRNKLFVASARLYQDFITMKENTAINNNNNDDNEPKNFNDGDTAISSTTTTTTTVDNDEKNMTANTSWKQSLVESFCDIHNNNNITTNEIDKNNEKAQKIFRQNKNRDITTLVPPQTLWNELLAPAMRRIMLTVEKLSTSLAHQNSKEKKTNNNKNSNNDNSAETNQDAAALLQENTISENDEENLLLSVLSSSSSSSSQQQQQVDSFLEFCKNVLKTGHVSPSQCIRIISKNETLFLVTKKVFLSNSCSNLDLALASIFIVCSNSLLSTKIIYEVRAAVQVESHRTLSRERQLTLEAAEKLHHFLILDKQNGKRNQTTHHDDQQQQQIVREEEHLETICKSIRSEISNHINNNNNNNNSRSISLPSSFGYLEKEEETSDENGAQQQVSDDVVDAAAVANNNIDKNKTKKISSSSQIIDEVHSEFTCINSDTARIFSSGPSLQTLPRSDKSILKSCFVVGSKGNRTGQNKFVALDYSQFELRVLAHLSGDQNLIQSFRQGKDVVNEIAEELMRLLLSQSSSSSSNNINNNTSENESQHQQNQIKSDMTAASNQNNKKKNLLKMVNQQKSVTQDDAASTIPKKNPASEFFSTLSNALRSITKIIIYGIIFGIGDDTLVQRTKEALYEMLVNFDEGDVEEEQTKTEDDEETNKKKNNKIILEIIQNDLIDPKQVRTLFHRRFPQIKPWMDAVVASTRNFGIVTTLSGFTRKFFSTTTTTTISSNQDALLSSNNNNNNKKPATSATAVIGTKSFAYSAVARQAVATLVQGTAADILKIAISEAFKTSNSNSRNKNNVSFALVLALHDELVFSVSLGDNESDNLKEIIQHLQEAMCRAGDVLMAEITESDDAGREVFQVPLEVKVNVGDSLGEMKKL